jgi:putative NIF3 family GTP cyclohydrolase 1 type 2
VQQLFGCGVIRHSRFTGKKISKVALCGGAGSFLITSALSAGADAFITADLKYHEFFEPDGKLLLCDIGHYESEQFTISLLDELLRQKFPTFAILKTELNTNPIHYYS